MSVATSAPTHGPAAPMVRTGTPIEKHSVAIDVERMSFFYGEKQALFDITAQLRAKLVTAFIGPSGCGKSTFLRTLNRMNDIIPHARVTGQVQVEGRDIYGPSIDPVSLRREVGMVFQKSNPFPKSIFENVAYGVRLNRLVSDRGQLNAVVEESLRQAALWDEVKDRLPIATQRIEELIYQLRTAYAIVIVTHNMQQAARVSDMTALFWLGKLVEFDRTDKIFTNPREKINADLERVGDLAVNLAEAARRYLASGRLPDESLLSRMSEIAETMLENALQAFVSGNLGVAQAVLERDDALDSLRGQAYRRLVEVMIKNPAVVTSALELMLMTRHLERIGDHATNIAEDVFFVVAGEDVRHQSAGLTPRSA